MRVGDVVVTSVDALSLSGQTLNTARSIAAAEITAALRAAGYPERADAAAGAIIGDGEDGLDIPIQVLGTIETLGDAASLAAVPVTRDMLADSQAVG